MGDIYICIALDTCISTGLLKGETIRGNLEKRDKVTEASKHDK
jgi:hypothetical protein